MKSHATHILIGLGLVLFWVLPLTTGHSQPKGQSTAAVTYQWPPVSGAIGYLIEIRDSSGKQVFAERTPRNQFTAQLSAGNYEHRIAALNKFHKAGPFSAWVPLVVRFSRTPELNSVFPERIKVAPAIDPNRTRINQSRRIVIKGENLVPDSKVSVSQDGNPIQPKRVLFQNDGELHAFFDVATLRPGNLAIRVENPGGKVAPQTLQVAVVEAKPGERSVAIRPMRKDPSRSVGKKTAPQTKTVAQRRLEMLPRALIPIYGPLKRGDKWELGLWAGLYGSYALAGAYEYSQGNAAAAAAKKQPIGLLTDPAFVSLAGSRLASATVDFNAVAATAVLAQVELNGLKKQYRVHQTRQVAIGGLALATYLVQVYGESFDGFSPGKLLPGLPQFKNDNKWEAAFWSAAFVGLAGGGIYTVRAANAEARNAKNDPLIQTFATPLGASLVYSQIGSSNQNLFLSLVSAGMTARSQSEAVYRYYVNWQKGLAGTAFVMGVAYLVMLPPADAVPGSQAAGELNSVGPLVAYEPAERGRTSTRLGWMFSF